MSAREAIDTLKAGNLAHFDAEFAPTARQRFILRLRAARLRVKAIKALEALLET